MQPQYRPIRAGSFELSLVVDPLFFVPPDNQRFYLLFTNPSTEISLVGTGSGPFTLTAAFYLTPGNHIEISFNEHGDAAKQGWGVLHPDTAAVVQVFTLADIPQ